MRPGRVVALATIWVIGGMVIGGIMSANAAEVIVRRAYPGHVLPGYAYLRAREPAPGTSRALDGVRNGTTREERDRHGGPEIDLTGRPVLTGRYREFQF